MRIVDEMKRRREFYSQPSHSAYDRKMSAEARGGVCPTMYDSKEKSEEQASRFSLILQHCAFLPPLNSNGTWDQAQLRDEVRITCTCVAADVTPIAER